jgi:hypothetical protein
MATSSIARAGWILATGLLLACSGKETTLEEPPVQARGRMTFALAPARHADVYLFNGEGARAGGFNRKLVNVSSRDDQLSVRLPEGKWNLTLVSAGEPLAPRLILPPPGSERSRAKMWETTPVNGVLPPVPEIRLGHLDGQRVKVNVEGKESVTLSRNVARVLVRVQEGHGFKEDGHHVIRLHEVPTSLSWSGSLYPSAASPEVSRDPMTGTVRFTTPPRARHQESDTLAFIIPAHAGHSPSDTTLHRMKVSVDLELANGERYRNEGIVIPRVPRANGVLLLRLFARGMLEIETEVLAWKDEKVDVEMGPTLLYVSEPAVTLALVDTIYVRSSGGAVTVSPGASWISCRQLPATGGQIPVVLEADANSFNTLSGERSSYVSIKVHNVTKRVRVTQRPERGTISVNKRHLYLSPVATPDRESDVVTLFTPFHPWSTWENNHALVTLSRTSGTGRQEITFKRRPASSARDRGAYGDEVIVFKNHVTLDTTRVTVHNLFLEAPARISAGNPLSGNDTLLLVDGLAAYGGSARLAIASKPSWVVGLEEHPATGKTGVRMQREPDNRKRSGTLVVHHANDRDYKATIAVEQSSEVTITSFDYLVIRCTWPVSDMDIAFRFHGNKNPANGKVMEYDDRGVGFGQSYGIFYKGDLLYWTGDQSGQAGESVCLDAPILDADKDSPREVNMELFANWNVFRPKPSEPMQIELTAYKGGVVDAYNGVFKNDGGRAVFNRKYKARVDSRVHATKHYDGSYTKVAIIVYDRVEHVARVELLTMTK